MLYLNILVLFGVIAIASSRQLNRDYGRDYDQFGIQEVQELLKNIQQKTKEKMNHRSHHKAHKGKDYYQHDADYNRMNIQTLNLIFKHNDLRRDKPADSQDDIDNENKVNKIMCAITGSYGCGRSDDRDDRNDSSELKKIYLDDDSQYEVEAKNDIDMLLNDLEKNLKSDKGNYESEKKDRVKAEIRCDGKTCQLFLTDREDELRCGKCSIDNDNSLRCGACGRSAHDDDTRADNDDLRCVGDRCGINRADDDRDDDDNNDRRDDGWQIDDRNELRCKGDRCGRSHNEADIDSTFKSVLDNHGKRYKINNELDAIVLDVDNLDDVLEALSSINTNSDDSRVVNRNEKKRVAKDRQRELSHKQQDNRDNTWSVKSLADDNVLLLQGPLDLRNQPKTRSLLPLTLKQKIRQVKHMSGKNANVGTVNIAGTGKGAAENLQLPFEFEVQGLGQANNKPMNY